MQGIVFIDTETNNLLPDRQPWEVALIVPMLPGGPDDGYVEYAIQIEDYDFEMSDEAAQVNGFNSRHLKDDRYQAVSSRFAASFLSIILQGRRFVGSNPTFDQVALTNLLALHGMEPTWHYRTHDVPDMAFGKTGRYAGGLEATAEMMNVDLEGIEAHTALDDCRMALGIWNKVLARD